MITFEYPWALLLMIPLTLLLVLFPCRKRLLSVLQFVIYLLLCCALGGIALQLPQKEGVLFILCDRSSSMPSEAEKGMLRQIKALSNAMKRTPGIISFAGTQIVEQLPGEERFKEFSSILKNREASDIDSAVKLALSLIPRDTPGRILLISDGNWNGIDPEKSFYAAAMRKINVDFLPLKELRGSDFSMEDISAPSRGVPGEVCTIACRIYAPFASELQCRIRKNKGHWQTRKLKLKAGENHIYWRDKNLFPGVADYEFELLPPAVDTVQGNNYARQLVEVAGQHKVLLLTLNPGGNLARVLGKNFALEVMEPSDPKLTPGTLGNYQAIVLENIPGAALKNENQALLAELVKSGRTGLLMTGGRAAFAVGGWFKTPIGEILPVAMDKQHNIRRRNSAVMMALDRSGSMAANVEGVTKMHMANLAAVESYNLLEPEDEFGLIAVDSSVHYVADLGKKGKSADPAGDILAIESRGGGIFVDKALHECVRQLANSKLPVRHVLLFADAADAEQPGDYKELLAKSAKAGITVSVVGLGSPSDSDAELLRDIARRGGGKCYFAEDPQELPRVFAEDTFIMVKAAFREGRVTGAFTPQMSAFPGGGTLRGKVAVGGYNLCFPREKSTVLLKADDEENPPLAVTGFAGLGKTAAVTFEVDGIYSGEFAKTPAAGTLLTALVRYTLMPRSLGAESFMVTSEARNGNFRCEILLDPEEKKLPFTGTPRLSVLLSLPGGEVEKRTLDFTWETPDRLRAQTPLPPGATVNAALEIAGKTPLILPPALQSASAEFSRESEKDLLSLVLSTGGRVKSRFDDMVQFLPRSQEEHPLVKELLVLAVILILVQVFCRRSGVDFTLPKLALPHFKRKAPAPVKKDKKHLSPPAEEKQPQKKEEETDTFSEALSRAKGK